MCLLLLLLLVVFFWWSSSGGLLLLLLLVVVFWWFSSRLLLLVLVEVSRVEVLVVFVLVLVCGEAVRGATHSLELAVGGESGRREGDADWRRSSASCVTKTCAFVWAEPERARQPLGKA